VLKDMIELELRENSAEMAVEYLMALANDIKNGIATVSAFEYRQSPHDSEMDPPQLYRLTVDWQLACCDDEDGSSPA
jgi:hypothetical protein